jgi:RNA-directed DNA polymerase
MIDYYQTKEHPITKKMVWDAFKEIRSNGKAAGVDGVTLEDYHKNLSGNLYKLWNRLTSGSYFPQHVREKKIDKKSGGKRMLGIPTVNDRIAQQVVKMYLEPKVDHTFHPDSYGYRRGKSAHQAIEKVKERTDIKAWKWVIDIDIEKFFDTINHDLMLKAVQHYTKDKWVLMYVERWLKAGLVSEEGEVIARESGTPQGGVISPLLANIYLHFAFDMWVKRTNGMPFERFCDDIIVHCASEKQAIVVLDRIRRRLKKCGLKLNEEKSKIVYCRNEWRREKHEHSSFDFLGYTFRPRYIKTVQGYMLSFSPEISRKSMKSINEQIRSMRLHSFTGTVQLLANMINEKVRGWMGYFCKFSKWSTEKLWWRLNRRLIKWIEHLRKMHTRQAVRWWKQVYKTKPLLFVHWKIAHL